ncbi:MAG: hypothetical protein FJ146_18520 [Deltaproteobacteria bacterium]|nr:hypothetical protein [Deltaproteobacteria bacterium]
MACGHACRGKLMADFELESMLTEEVGAIPASPPKRVRPRLRMVHLQPPRVIKKKAPEAESDVSHPTTDEAPEVAAPAKEGATEATPDEHDKETAEVKKVEHA